MKRPVQIQILLGLLGLSGVALIIFTTSRYGACMTTISGDIISAAKSLLAFEGYLQYDGRPYVEYPPLLPTLVAMIGVTGIDPTEAIRYLNAVCFGLIVFLAGRWLNKNITLLPLVLLGTVSFVLSFPLISVSICAWAETVFALLILLFLCEFEKYLETGKTSAFYLAAVYAALCCLTRYLGVVAILTGVVLLFLRREETLRRNVRRAVIFGVVAVLPTVVWIVRNYLLTGQLSGERGVSNDSLADNVYYTATILSSWFVPPRVPDAPRILVAVLVAVGFFVWAGRLVRASRTSDADAAKMRKVLPAAFFTVGYVVVLVIVASVVALDGLNSRFFAPVYVPMFLPVLFAVDDLRNAAAKLLSGRIIRYGIVVVFALWLVPPARGVVRNVRVFAHVGAGGYSSANWRDSALIQYLKSHPLDGKIYSNEAYAANILTGVPARLSPRKHLFRAPETTTDDLALFKDVVKSGGVLYLVWFDEVERPYLYDVTELRGMFNLTVVDSLSDGSVYLVR